MACPPGVIMPPSSFHGRFHGAQRRVWSSHRAGVPVCHQLHSVHGFPRTRPAILVPVPVCVLDPLPPLTGVISFCRGGILCMVLWRGAVLSQYPSICRTAKTWGGNIVLRPLSKTDIRFQLAAIL